ncbi:hypothetical protein BH11BAC2_BH11BAC2_05800 [soil metagenome]
MKVRIKGNFIRYRLTKSEVEKISNEGLLEEQTHFGSNAVFSYALKRKEGISNLEADYKENKITIYMPATDADVWFKNNKVGYRTTVPVSGDTILVLLIEKDFQCLDEVEEDQSDNYPNPQA